MRMKIGLAFAVAGVLITGMAVGQDDPIATRQALMKRNGEEAKTAFFMVKGKTPFDATAAADAMNSLAADMEILPTLFPPGSETGGNTRASPDAFTNLDDLKALAAKLGTDAKAAAAAAAQGPEAFATAFNAIDADCSACHEKYRIRQQ